MSRERLDSGGDYVRQRGDELDSDSLSLIQTEPKSIQDLCAEFETFKQQRAAYQSTCKATGDNEIDAELSDLRKGIDCLRLYIDRLKLEIHELINVNVTPSGVTMTSSVSRCETCASLPREACGSTPLDVSSSADKPLVVTCKSTTCLFENCNRRMDSQLMLIHYLSDHSDDRRSYTDCHVLTEGERTTLSFFPHQCDFGRNEVLGLLTYAGTVEEQIYETNNNVIFNSFLPKDFEHLEGHIPIIVMICKTTTSAVLKDKMLAKRFGSIHAPDKQIFVIWLVSPNGTVHINATLSICGRDPINTLSTIIAVRHVCHTQNTNIFMPIDCDYWRLTYKEMQKMSNGFRDQLHLEIALARCDSTV